MKSIRVIDSHTAGEPTRVIVAGGPDLGSGPLSERRLIFQRECDDLQHAVIGEPRGSDVLVGAMLCEPTDPECAAGVVFFNNAGVLQMCGHGTIGLMATLAWMNRVSPGIHRIETPVGVVTATLHDQNRASIQNVPSYRSAHKVSLNLAGGQSVSGDVAWGGNWFFLCSDHGQELSLNRTAQLTQFAWQIRDALVDAGITGDDGGQIDHVELFGPLPFPDPRPDHCVYIAGFVLQCQEHRAAGCGRPLAHRDQAAGAGAAAVRQFHQFAGPPGAALTQQRAYQRDRVPAQRQPGAGIVRAHGIDLGGRADADVGAVWVGMDVAAHGRLQGQAIGRLLDRCNGPAGAVAVTGQAGLPELTLAGNVLRPHTSLKLSIRVPPTCDTARGAAALKAELERDPPHGARVRFEVDAPGDGWEAPAIAPWLRTAVDDASEAFFGAPAVLMGEGGSIPFMGMLGEQFPEAQFLITGVLGPASNAHGPNEFLHIPMGKKLTSCVADVLDAHARRS